MSKAKELLNLLEDCKYQKELFQVFSHHGFETPYDCTEDKVGDKEYLYRSLCHQSKSLSNLATEVSKDIDQFFISQHNAKSDTSFQIEQLSEHLFGYVFESTVIFP